MASQEPMLRSVQVLKQDADNIKLEGQETAQYVKQQQRLDREESSLERCTEEAKRQAEADAQKIQTEAGAKDDGLDPNGLDCSRSSQTPGQERG